MPAERLLAALGLVLLALAAGLLEPALVPAALAADVLLAAAFGVDLVRARRTGLAAARRWPRLLFQEQPAELLVEVENRSGRAVTLRLREGLHPALAEAPRRTEERLPAGGRLRWGIGLAPRRRGEHPAGPLTARVLGPWRLAWSQRDLLGPEPRKVFPRIRWEGRVGSLLALARRRRLGQATTRLHGVGSEIYGVRDYQPGDPLSRIHWKATARHGRPVSREDTWERGGRLVILLDCGRSMASVDAGRSKLDHALAAALALLRVAVARGDAVTLVAFSDRVERTVRVRSAGRGVATAYARLYDLEARLAEPAYETAVEAATAREARGATAVLLTSVVDLAAAEVLRAAVERLERRHRPILVNLEDPELHRLGRQAPETPAAAFAQVAALEVRLGNRRLGRRMRRSGVRFVSTPADTLALETLSEYLALFGGVKGRRRAAAG